MSIDFDSVLKNKVPSEIIATVNIEECHQCIKLFFDILYKCKRKKYYLEGSGISSIDLTKERVDGSINPDNLQLNEYIAQLGRFIEIAETAIFNIADKSLNKKEANYLQNVLINKKSYKEFEIENKVSHSTRVKIGNSCIYKLCDGLGLIIEKNDDVVQKMQYMKSRYFGYGG